MIRFICKQSLALLFVPLLAHSAKLETDSKTSTFHKQVNALIEKLRVPMEQCPERVWPRYRWMGKDNAVLIVDTESKQAVFWDLKLDKVTTPSFTELPIQSHSFFGVFDYKERNTVSVNFAAVSESSPSAPWDNTFDLLVHEAFHFFGQVDDFWARKPTEMPRGTYYPSVVEPRGLRTSVLLILEGQINHHLNSDHKLSLTEAASYYDLWLTDYPEEKLADTDRLEGSAEYVTIRTKAIAARGCQASESEIAMEMGSDLEVHITATLDLEAYSLGLLSGLALDLLGKNDDWKTRVNKGDSLADILFEGEQTIPVTVNIDLEKIIAEVLDGRMERVTPYLDPVVEGLKDKSLVLISVPNNWQNDGSYSPFGFYLLRDLDNLLTIIYAAPLASWSENSSSRIERLVGSSAIQFEGGCEGSNLYVLVPGSELEAKYKKGDSLTYSSEFYRIKARADHEKMVSGHRLICLQ